MGRPGVSFGEFSRTPSGALSVASAAVLGSWCGSPLTSHFRIGFPIRTPPLSGEPEDGSWWMPERGLIGSFGTRSAVGLEIPECLECLGSSSSGSHRRTGQEPGNRLRFGPTVRTSLRREAHESIGRGRPRFAAGTDLCREQGPGVAGHRDLLVLRAGARDVRNSMRVKAPRGVRLCGGVRLWRAKTP